MTAEKSATPPLLPVSILAGPSGRALLQDLVSQGAKSRFGLLASSNVDSQVLREQLKVDQLARAGGGGYDPEQLRAQISAIALAAAVDHLIIECDSKTHPIAFASLFLPDGSPAGQRFAEKAQLSSIVMAIDSEALLNSLVHGTDTPDVTSPCILADQIECADVVVLNGEPADRDCLLARAVASALNPRGHILQRSRGATPPNLMDGGTSFDFQAALTGAGWQRLMEGEPGAHCHDQGVTTFVYRARRPFHPEKFWSLIQRPFPGVFRAKGFFWLAPRMDIVGGLNVAGRECYHSPAGQWWAAHAAHDHSGHSEIPDRIKKEWVEPFGDRRQAIAFMGIEANSADLSAQLDACLLTESEMESGEDAWAMISDPFPPWSAKGHDHECEEHDCCHH